MGLVIKFLGQPYPGREITVDDSKDEVKFGRGIDCDVSFPEDMAIVSRSHFALKRELDGYKFVINREKPVFMNGRPVYDDQDMPKTGEIQLSGPTGPKLRLERTEGAPSNQIKTEILKPQKDLSEVVADTRSSGRRTSSVVGLVALIVVVLGVGGYFIAKNMQGDIATVQHDIASIQKDLPQLKAQPTGASGASQASIASIISKNKESVYLVADQLQSGTRDGEATASVVLLPDGTKALATNSHVADHFNELKSDSRMAGVKMVVVQPKAPDYQTLEVVRVQKHPGYDELNKWQEAYFNKAQSLSAQHMEFVPGFDVALLYVADPSKLGDPLPYAPREKMLALSAGAPLVLIGYPAELLNGTNSAKPEPTSQTGIITSLTTYFLSHSPNAEDNMLIQHSAPATGGASGSPMFNSDGQVVAFLNAGNIVMVKNGDGDTERMPSPAQVNYAQRADLLLDLAEGKADAKMQGYRDQMAKADEDLTKTPEAYIQDLVAFFGQEMGDQKNVAKVSDLAGTMDTPVPWMNGRKGVGINVPVDQPGVYLVGATSDDKRIIQTSLYEVQPDGSVTALKSGPDLTPYSFAVAPREQAGKLFVVVADMSIEDPSKDTRPPGKVKIYVYRGTPGKKET